MFKIENDRDTFFQWDLNQRLIVEDKSINQVHFCNKTDSCSLVCETYLDDDVLVVDVPNILLQTDWNINVYAYCINHTKVSAVFKVHSRTKPTDYVYEETEVLNWEAMKDGAEEIAAAALEEAKDYTKSYVNTKTTLALTQAKAYTDEQTGTLVKKGENWTDKPGNVTKIILPSASYYFPDDNENENSFYIQSDWHTWMAFTKPGETLVFDILENKENKLVTVIDEATGKEKAKIQDTWGIYSNIEYCNELGADFGCIFYCYNDAKVYADEVGSKATEAAVEESQQYVDKKISSLLNGYAFGDVIAIDDISPVSKDITVKMESKNLLDISSLYGQTVTLNGGTITCNEDGSFAVSGTPTAACSLTLKASPLPSGVYTLSIQGDFTNFACSLYFRDKENNSLGSLGVNTSKNSVTFNTDNYNECTHIVYEFKRQTNDVEMSGYAYCQLEKSLIATGYTPYITDMSLVGVNMYGEDLFKGNTSLNTTTSGIAIKAVDKHSFILSGTNTGSGTASYKASDQITLKAGTYTLIATGFEKSNDGLSLNNVNGSARVAMSSKGNPVTFTIDADTVVQPYFVFSKGTTFSNTKVSVILAEGEPINYPAWLLEECGYKLVGLCPDTTLCVDTKGATMDVEYSRDLNKVIGDLEQAIISLGGNV